MTNAIVLSIILLIMVGISHGSMMLAKKNPNLISGFEMSNEPEQRKRDEAWLKLLYRYMDIANILFVHSKNDFVRITQKDGSTYYLSYKDKTETEHLFHKIQKLIKPMK